jgi:Mrp family chromosome partitioning ATPase
MEIKQYIAILRRWAWLIVLGAVARALRRSGCLLVARAGQTRRESFIDSVERLAKADALPFGAVINQLKKGQSGYYYDYYYQHYNYIRQRRQKSACPCCLAFTGLVSRS